MTSQVGLPNTGSQDRAAIRVLWFVNVPIGAMIAGDRTGSGGWMDALLNTLQQTPSFVLGVCCVTPELENKTFQHQGVSYFTRSMPGAGHRRLTMYRDDDDRHQNEILALCRSVVEEFQPDLIHIHGTERVYGLLSSTGISCPVLLSIQGLVSVYASWINTFGNYALRDVVRFHSPLQTLRGFGPLWDLKRLRHQGQREEAIIISNRYFCGRTDWDHAHVMALNPQARYFIVNELLRPIFSQHTWSIDAIRRHSLFFANGRGPRRNVECLLRTVALLVPWYPSLRLRIGGTTGEEDRYTRSVAALARTLCIQDNVQFLGLLSAEQISEELRSAHAFVLPSRIENSANSLCEAQLMGVPSIAGNTGGTPSLIEHGRSGLLVPVDDESMLAFAVQHVFEDDRLALHLSEQSSRIARQRHECDAVRKELITAYRQILDETAAS